MDLAEFLAPLEGPSPSGIDLRNEARFHALERLLEPASRAQRIEAERSSGPGTVPLDWSEVAAAARDLAAAGRDLRLLAIVARAAASEDGFAGLADGLGLLAETITTYWDSVHPLLRENPSPREAAIRRINAVYQIENADGGLLCDLEFNPVMKLPVVGAITGADLAAGALNRAAFVSEAPSGLGEKEMAALIAQHETRVAKVTAACRAMAAERGAELEEMLANLARAREKLAALEAALNAHVTENGVGVRFQVLSTFLSRVEQSLQAGKSEAPAASPAPAEAAAAAAAPPSGGSSMPTAPVPAPAMNGAAIPGRITSRSEVEQCLDLIIDFYERTEPSSPIPHLARRMRKMVPMNFMQLMEEIAPSGMKEFRNVAGVFDEKAK